MGKQFWKPGNMLYPLPAVMVSCQRKEEKPNIITVAWVGTVCTDPAMVFVSIRPQRYSYDIIRETGEFVINLTTEQLTRAADYCGVRSGRDVDKFQEMHLTPCTSRNVSAPGIMESPVNIECKVKEIIKLGSHDMFLAEVVGVDVDEECLDENGKFHLNETGLIAYSHGEYFSLGDYVGKFGYSVRKKVQEKGPKDKAKKPNKQKIKRQSRELKGKVPRDKTQTEKRMQSHRKAVRDPSKSKKPQ